MAPPSKKTPSQKPKPALNQLQKPSQKPFKPKTKPDAAPAAKSRAVAMQLEDDVPDFPRGTDFYKLACISYLKRSQLKSEVSKLTGQPLGVI